MWGWGGGWSGCCNNDGSVGDSAVMETSKAGAGEALALPRADMGVGWDLKKGQDRGLHMGWGMELGNGSALEWGNSCGSSSVSC